MRNFYKFTFLILLSLCAKAQVPTATILSTQAYYCSDAPIYFVAHSSNGPTSYSWTVPANRGASFISGGTGTADSSVVCSFSLPGVFTITLTVANGSLSSTTTKTLSVTRSAIAAFNASLVSTGFPTQISLTNYSSNALKSYWKYSDTPQPDSAAYLLHAYNNAGSYTVTLVALGKNGCNDTLDYAFRISDSSSVILPNIFSPNDDDVNDVFMPITRGISSLSAWVYDRYGVPIISWNTVNGTWDGYTTSGLKCSVGQYFVIVNARGFDGKSYKLKTTLTLVR